MLTVHLLGPPEIRYDNKTLSFPTSKAFALLIYLIVENKSQLREKLAAIFWPESDRRHAYSALRSTIRYLRQALESADCPEENFLQIKRQSLEFISNNRLDFDLDRVEQKYQLASSPGVPDLDSLRETVQIVRGDFLDGFSLGDAPKFDDWINLQREFWHRRVSLIFDRLTRVQMGGGDYLSAAEILDRWLAHDPWNEAVYRRKIRLHYLRGERAAALETYQSCQETLSAELGLEPAPATVKLVEMVRKQPPKSRRAFWVGSSVRDIFRVPLVGRSQEHARFSALYHALDESGVQGVLLTGQAGVGKSFLSTAFLEWAKTQGADVMSGRAFESEGGIPYQPMIDALRPRVDQENAPEDLLDDVWLAELARLLPELRERYPDLPQVDEGEETAQARLFESLALLGIAFSRKAPLVIFVDDLQWADQASRALLIYLARRWRQVGAPILILASARTAAIQSDEGLKSWATDFNEVIPVTSIQIEPLGKEELQHWIAQIGTNVSTNFIDWLYEYTAGLPFYIVETLKYLHESGLLSILQDGDTHKIDFSGAFYHIRSQPQVYVPPSILNAISTRLGRLNPSEFALLTATTVLERGSNFEILHQVAHLDDNAALRALDELLARQMLVETDDVQRPYHISHDLIRHSVYNLAGDARRQVFHRRALEVLEKSSASLGELAHHALAAGDKQKAVHYSLSAGENALRLFAVQEAIHHFEQARKFFIQDEVNETGQIYSHLGRAYELSGDYDQALAVYTEFQEVAQKRDDRPLELSALMARTTIYAAPTQYYDPESVDVLTQEALPLARELDDHTAEAKILWNLMLLNLFTGKASQAVADGEASLEIARKYDLVEQQAYALHDLMRAYLFTGQRERGLEAGTKAQKLWRQLGNKAMLADNLVGSGANLILAGDYDQGIELVDEALALSEDINNLWNQSYSRHVMSLVLFDRGAYSRFIRICEEAIEIGIKAGFMIPLVANGVLLSFAYADLGQYELALDWAERALDQAEKMTHVQDAPLAAIAHLHICQGKPEQARPFLERALECYEPNTLAGGIFTVNLVAAELALAEEQYEDCLKAVKTHLTHLRQRELLMMQADGLYLRGRALLAQGEIESAIEALSEAWQILASREAKRSLWRVLNTLNEIEQLRGNQGKANEYRADALKTVEAIVEQIDAPNLKETFIHADSIRMLTESR